MKNILRNIAILLASSAMVLGVSSCGKDLLDTVPSQSFASSNVWQSPILARAALNGVYNALYTRFAMNYTGGTMGIPSDAYSSVMDIDANWKGACIISPGNMTPSTGNITTHFKYYYGIVYRANDVINNIESVPEMDKDEVAQIKAEALFLRAWAYYNLNVLWKGVPVYTENVAAADATKARSTEAEVWSQIINDITAALPSLPAKVKGGERASQGAAYTLRGIVYQHMGNFSSALDDFKKVETCGYSLFSPSNGAKGNDDYFQLFKPANEQCDEMIFAVACVETTDMGNPRGINYGNRCTGGSAWNNYLPNPAFVERFEEADGSQFNWEDYIEVELLDDENFNLFQEYSKSAFVVYDLETNNYSWSQNFEEILEGKLSFESNIREIIGSLIFPDDLPHLEYVEDNISLEKQVMDVYYRIKTFKGNIKYLHVLNRLIIKDGKIVKFLSIFKDVTDYNLQNKELNRLYDTLKDVQTLISLLVVIKTISRAAFDSLENANYNIGLIDNITDSV